MCIDDILFACAIDDSLAYFTYEGSTMLIVNSKKHAKQGISGFKNIEYYIDAIISHESIHAVMRKIEPNVDADAIDDIEVIVSRGNIRFQITMNNMAFASDASGLVLPDNLIDP
jgi:TATA-box binding protein (TBP) (component of TFIID and TFIIIB)